MASFKLVFEDDVRKISLENISIQILYDTVQFLFPALALHSFESLFLYYYDEDTDKIRIKSESDLIEAVRYSLEKNITLKIYVQCNSAKPNRYVPEQPSTGIAGMPDMQALFTSFTPMISTVTQNPEVMQQILPAVLPLLPQLFSSMLGQNASNLNVASPAATPPSASQPPVSSNAQGNVLDLLFKQFLNISSTTSSSIDLKNASTGIEPDITSQTTQTNETPQATQTTQTQQIPITTQTTQTTQTFQAPISTQTQTQKIPITTQTTQTFQAPISTQTTQTQSPQTQTTQTFQTPISTQTTQTFQTPISTQTTQTQSPQTQTTQTQHIPITAQTTQTQQTPISTQTQTQQTPISTQTQTQTQKINNTQPTPQGDADVQKTPGAVKSYDFLNGTLFGGLLVQMAELGFTDTEKCVQALVKNGGNLAEAVDELLLDQLMV